MAFDPAPFWTHVRQHAGVIGWREAAALGASHRDLSRFRTLTHDDVQAHRGTTVTTPVRTIVDSAINRSVAHLSDIVARSLQRSLLELDELSDGLERAGKIGGSGRLREAIGRVGPDAATSESVAEEAARVAFQRAGIDAVAQYPVEAGGRRHRLDFAFPDQRLGVEVDGHWWHSTPGQKARDDRRQNLLAGKGWRVLRFGAGKVLRRPDAVVAEVAEALRSPSNA